MLVWSWTGHKKSKHKSSSKTTLLDDTSVIKEEKMSHVFSLIVKCDYDEAYEGVTTEN